MQLNIGQSRQSFMSGDLPVPDAEPFVEVSRSLAMHQISRQIQNLGNNRLILIEGEAGTGKQILAKRIYSQLRRATSEGAFRTGIDAKSTIENSRSVWVGAKDAGRYVSEDAALAFAEGHELLDNGQNAGIAHLAIKAAGGVLVLRGIDELNKDAQARLLRFVRCFENEIPDSAASPARVLCTSRHSLRARALNGEFLPEIYYRLSAVCFLLPSLRERKEDLPGLAQFFIGKFARQRHQPLQGLGQGALAVLLRHRWPGNVRELESVLRAACFSTQGQWIRPLDLVILPLENHQTGDSKLAPPPDLNLDRMIQRHVYSVLKLCSGNKARAASKLGISRSTLYRMLNSWRVTTLQDQNSGELKGRNLDS